MEYVVPQIARLIGDGFAGTIILAGTTGAKERKKKEKNRS